MLKSRMDIWECDFSLRLLQSVHLKCSCSTKTKCFQLIMTPRRWLVGGGWNPARCTLVCNATCFLIVSFITNARRWRWRWRRAWWTGFGTGYRTEKKKNMLSFPLVELCFFPTTLFVKDESTLAVWRTCLPTYLHHAGWAWLERR